MSEIKDDDAAESDIKKDAAQESLDDDYEEITLDEYFLLQEEENRRLADLQSKQLAVEATLAEEPAKLDAARRGVEDAAVTGGDPSADVLTLPDEPVVDKHVTTETTEPAGPESVHDRLVEATSAEVAKRIEGAVNVALATCEVMYFMAKVQRNVDFDEIYKGLGKGKEALDRSAQIKATIPVVHTSKTAVVILERNTLKSQGVEGARSLGIKFTTSGDTTQISLRFGVMTVDVSRQTTVYAPNQIYLEVASSTSDRLIAALLSEPNIVIEMIRDRLISDNPDIWDVSDRYKDDKEGQKKYLDNLVPFYRIDSFVTEKDREQIDSANRIRPIEERNPDLFVADTPEHREQIERGKYRRIQSDFKQRFQQIEIGPGSKSYDKPIRSMFPQDLVYWYDSEITRSKIDLKFPEKLTNRIPEGMKIVAKFATRVEEQQVGDKTSFTFVIALDLDHLSYPRDERMNGYERLEEGGFFWDGKIPDELFSALKDGKKCVLRSNTGILLDVALGEKDRSLKLSKLNSGQWEFARDFVDNDREILALDWYYTEPKGESKGVDQKSGIDRATVPESVKTEDEKISEALDKIFAPVSDLVEVLRREPTVENLQSQPLTKIDKILFEHDPKTILELVNLPEIDANKVREAFREHQGQFRRMLANLGLERVLVHDGQSFDRSRVDVFPSMNEPLVITSEDPYLGGRIAGITPGNGGYVYKKVLVRPAYAREYFYQKPSTSNAE